MKKGAKQKKIAIILAIITLGQTPLLFLYLVHFHNASVTNSLISVIASLVIAIPVITLIYFYKGPETEYQDKKTLFANIFKSLDKPWLRQQVETHLFFGFMSQYIKLSWLFLALIFGYFFYGLTKTDDPFLSYSLSYIKTWWSVVLVLYFFSGVPKYRQAAIGWFICKGACLILVLLFSIGCFFTDDTDLTFALLAMAVLLLLWLPSFEFITKITPHQKYLTIARIVLTYAIFQF